MDEGSMDLIKQTVEELLAKGGFQIKTELTSSMENGEENIVCNILTKEDSSFLIGQYGVNLQALQHLIRLIVRKKTTDKINFVLDINSYRQQKNQTVIDQAHLAAEQALNEGRAIVLRPMSAYERRLIHMELSKNDKVITESIGEGEDRKVVVKPAGAI
jgi:spoIIIJ-associated protein